MQLFTIGLYELNQDGTPQLDATGNHDSGVHGGAGAGVCAGIHRVDVCAAAGGGSPAKFPNGTANYDMPMAAVESAHDTTAKILLNGTILPAGQTAEQDLAGRWRICSTTRMSVRSYAGS